MPAQAVVGNLNSTGSLPYSVVRIEGARNGGFCSGVLIAPDVVLTAAHCINNPGHHYTVYIAGRAISAIQAVRHPSYESGRVPSQDSGPDIALVKLARPAPGPAMPMREQTSVGSGDMVQIAGFGAGNYTNGAIRTLRTTTLLVHKTGQFRSDVTILVDPVKRGETRGAGSCGGDSGGPAFVRTSSGYMLVGVITWNRSINNDKIVTTCGGLTAIAPVSQSSGWISRTLSSLTYYQQQEAAYRPDAPPEYRRSGYHHRKSGRHYSHGHRRRYAYHRGHYRRVRHQSAAH